MLKDQGKNTSMLAEDYQCYIKPCGGFDFNQLREQLLKCQPNIKGFYDAVFICAGTNDTHGLQFDLSKFIMDYQKLIDTISSKLEAKKIVLIGLFPRTFCSNKHCSLTAPKSCRNIHRGDIRKPIDFNIRIKSINGSIQRMINNLETSMSNLSFLDLFSDVWYPGGWFDGGANATQTNLSHYLADDGLHLGRDGNNRLDEALVDHLMSL